MKNDDLNTINAGVTSMDDPTEPNLIVISLDLIPPHDRDAWIIANEHLYANQTGVGTQCGHNVLLDLSIISTDDAIPVQQWLRDNTSFICFEDSYRYMEALHHITDPVYKASVLAATPKKIISFEKIRREIQKLTPTHDFDLRGYEGYVRFTGVFNTNPTFSYEYALGAKGHFSVPFLRSIRAAVRRELGNNVLEKDISFTFVNVAGTIAFVVNARHNTLNFEEFYNFSTDPHRPGTHWSF